MGFSSMALACRRKSDEVSWTYWTRTVVAMGTTPSARAGSRSHPAGTPARDFLERVLQRHSAQGEAHRTIERGERLRGARARRRGAADENAGQYQHGAHSH